MSATLPLVETSAPARRDLLPLAAARDVAYVGGKAATLSRLAALGITVPDGVVLTVAAFDAHLATHDLSRQIDEIVERLDARDTAALPRASRAIRALVTAAPLDETLRADLLAAAAPLLIAGPVVVRSSAVGEDSSHGSFAGQLDSILHVTDALALERAVLACWASYWSDRALFYRCARGLPLRGMGVILQRQVDARCAGVLFTDAGGGDLLVEYGAGLADALVAGATDPGRLSVHRATRRVRTLAVLGDPAGDIDAMMRDDARVEAFVELAQRLEDALGGPQDIEWAIDAAGTLHVVQSRPITAPMRAAAGAPAATRRVAWSNANVNENFPDPISPLLYSIASAGYTHYFRNLALGFGISRRRVRAMEPALARIIGVHGARMYYNLSSIHHVLRSAPFGHELAHAFDTFVGARGQDATASVDQVDEAAPINRLRERLELVVIACKTAWRFVTLPLRVARFERRVDRVAEATQPSALGEMPLESLRAALAGFMEIRLHRWNDAALADAAAMMCYAAFERVLGRAFPDGAHGAVHTSLLKAIPDVVSSKPVVELWALSRTIRATPALAELFVTCEPHVVLERVANDGQFAAFARQFDGYVQRWGFRCSAELMLTAPSFQEAPEPLVPLLRAYAALDGESPVDALARQAREREAETARVLTELRGRRLHRSWPFPTYVPVVRLLLAWTHAAIRFRERARLKQALLYSRCRRIALALGAELTRRELLARPDDVFWLTVNELDELASGGAMFPQHTRALVALRAQAHAEQTAVTPPDAFELDQGEYWTARHVVAPSATATTSVFAGISACGGTATGRACVLHDVTEAERLMPGDVLVTRQTDPGWGPVFFLISGLVIERGGMLSHGAIIAREFGIPCVVGVKDVTHAIPNGATITVDGDRGRVHVD